VLRIFGPGRDELAAVSRRLHGEELHHFALQNILLEVII
jgi:hypothetical protein